MAVKRFAVGPRMSGAVVNGNTVYLAGLTADDRSKDVKGQTAEILAKIDGLLKQAGTDKSRVLSANIWLTDIGTWSQMNEVWDKWVSPGNTPARATVEAKLAAPGLNVEIMVQAALPEGRAAAASRPAARKVAKKAPAKKKAAKKKR
jgi:enamine deaminase RidA (YjgF/YER057c/UK114 family)